MRVRFVWRADIPLELPVSYHRILQGIIYHNMKSAYEYSSFIHDEGYEFEKRCFRMFCFSHIMGKCRVVNRKIFFDGELSFEVSSPDVRLIRILADSVERNGLWFGRQHYPAVEVLFSDFSVETNEIFVKAISPIAVYSTYLVGENVKKTRYYFPGEEEFEGAVNDNFQRKYEAYFGVPAEGYVQIEPLQVKEKDKCVTEFKGIYITGYGGIYRLMGERKYLDFLYQTGVGAKNAQGFGMIEIQ